MPPSGFDREAIDGILRFVRASYRALQAEVKSGRHPNVEAAMEHEIRQLDKALSGIHIDGEGNLVDS